MRNISGKKLNACHEAGHAVVSHLFGLELKWVSLIPKDGYISRTEYENPLYGQEADAEITPQVIYNLEKYILCNLAGLAAENLLTNEIDLDGAKEDYQNVLDIIRYFSDSTKEIKDMFRLFEYKIMNIMTCGEVITAVEALSAALMETNELSGEEAVRIIEDARKIWRMSDSDISTIEERADDF